jgi:cyclophilin family peptidyl-prolyl cis-trans isomerase
MTRLSPNEAPPAIARQTASPLAPMRVYAARAARAMTDTATLRTLARDADDNVKEAAIDGLSTVARHGADDVYIAALGARGYQAVRAAARALQASPRGPDVFRAALAAALRLRADSSETSRDARMALIDRLGELAGGHEREVAPLANDFDCEIARAAAKIARVSPECHPLPRTLPADAVALALGKRVLLRVVLADSSGGGSFTVRLRGDVAPIMAARVEELARSGFYNDHAWYRVETDFVIQGGGPGNNEYVGQPRFMRDELSSLPQLRGTVGMSTRGHDTGDAQWFVNLRDNERLTRDYTAFAEVIDGMDVVDGVMEGDVIARIEVLNSSESRR